MPDAKHGVGRDLFLPRLGLHWEEHRQLQETNRRENIIMGLIAALRSPSLTQMHFFLQFVNAAELKFQVL